MPTKQTTEQEKAHRSFKHAGRCLHCREVIGAKTAKEWRLVVRAPCPYCGRSGL